MYEKKKTLHGARTHACGVFFFCAAGAAYSCSPAMHARGLNHFPPSGEEPPKHMENITGGGGGGGGT